MLLNIHPLVQHADDLNAVFAPAVKYDVRANQQFEIPRADIVGAATLDRIRVKIGAGLRDLTDVKVGLIGAPAPCRIIPYPAEIGARLWCKVIAHALRRTGALAAQKLIYIERLRRAAGLAFDQRRAQR